MIFKILKEYIRRITRDYKIYAISILGMSIAIIASFHIYHFVYKELSTDAFHTKRKDIYRLVNKNPNSNFRSLATPLPLGDLLIEKLPEVLDFVKARSVEDMKLNINEVDYKGEVTYVSGSFFEIFNFSLIEGSLQQFKDTPNGIIISEKIANTLFKGVNPIGNSITTSEDYKKKNVLLEIVGVMKNIPQTSTIQGDYFVNIDDFEGSMSNDMKWATTTRSTLYLYIPKLQTPNNISKKIENLVFEKMQAVYMAQFGEILEKSIYTFEIQPFDQVYFNSMDISIQKDKGDFQFLKIITLIGLLTLFLATTNYIIMNLGLNLNRAEEFKTRRYLGASKTIIFLQLIIESLFNASICFALILISYPILGSFIGEIIGFNYQLSLVNDGMLLIFYFGIILVIGFTIGALEFLLSYKVIFADQKDDSISSINSWFSKKVMITFQLFLFLVLMICILFVGKQVNFIQQKDLGFNANNVANIPTRNHKELKGVLDAKSYVKTTSYSYHLYSTQLQFGEISNINSNKKSKALFVHGDYNFLEVYDIELLFGENFPMKEVIDKLDKKVNTRKGVSEILVNEEFVRNENLKNPIGQIFKNDGGEEYVIKGVFKNVYNTPLYFPIQPLVILNQNYDGWYYGSLAVSYSEGNKQQLENDLKDFFTNKGKDPLFLDEIIWNYDYKDVYKKELILKRLLEAFTFIVLFISILGMIAISLFITESKTKEIGIRKVNGATVNEIMFMLNKDFIKWVLIAFVIACPIAYYAMSKWLENFAYKTTLSWWIFALAGVFTIVIALLTVSWQTYRAATRNPVESLRDE